MLRVMDAAVLLGVDAVCGFVGRNQKLQMDQNLVDFEEVFVPLLKEAKARGLDVPRRAVPDAGLDDAATTSTTTSPTRPGTWIALHRICEKHGVGDQLRIHYDPSHAILMGQDTRSIFQYLKDEGYDFLIGGFHVKGQVIDAKGVVGLGLRRPDRRARRLEDGKPSPNPADQVNAWKKQVVLCEHELPGTAQARSARLPAEPHRRLARPSARRARAAEARRREHAPGRRARVPEGAHPGQGAAQADPRRARSRSRARSTRRRPACTRCSTRCCRRRASRSRGAAASPTGHEHGRQHGQEAS